MAVNSIITLRCILEDISYAITLGILPSMMDYFH